MVVTKSSPTAKGGATAWVQVHAGQSHLGKLRPTDGTLAGLGLHSIDRFLAVTQGSATHPLFSRCDVMAEYAAQLAWQHDPRRVHLPEDGSQINVRIPYRHRAAGRLVQAARYPRRCRGLRPLHADPSAPSGCERGVADAYRLHLNPSAPPSSLHTQSTP